MPEYVEFYTGYLKYIIKLRDFFVGNVSPECIDSNQIDDEYYILELVDATTNQVVTAYVWNYESDVGGIWTWIDPSWSSNRYKIRMTFSQNGNGSPYLPYYSYSNEFIFEMPICSQSNFDISTGLGTFDHT